MVDRYITMSQIWHKVKAALAKRIPDHSFRMWIEPLDLDFANPHRVRLTCPNHFFKKRVVENFSHVICSELQKLTGNAMQLDIDVAEMETLPNKTLSAPQQMPLPGMTGIK